MCAKDKMEDKFKLTAPFGLSGDQPQAVEKLVRGFLEKDGTHQTLLGVTGSGKTFTMANVIARLNRPTLVLAHNKTLAAQLYSEFKEFFPENSVNYFVSYYDYYQPEAYIPASDVYIEKDASVNERIEKLRLMTTKALLERRDVVVVASVSCIYGLGKRKNYEDAIFRFACGERWERRDFMMKLLANYYERNDMTLVPGTFRSRGETMEIFPSYSDTALRIYFFDDEIERIDEIDPVSGNSVMRKEKAGIFPSKHYITSPDAIKNAAGAIEKEMEECCARFTSEGKYLEEERLRMRTKYDLEMRGWRPAGHAARLLPEGRALFHRRVAHDAAAGARHVQRRPRAQRDTRRARLPPAVVPRQQAAEMGRVRASAEKRALHLRDARRL